MGRLNLSLYGTRDAAQNLAIEYTQTLRAAGFVVGQASPCNFRHSSRDLIVTVLGDDFTSSGSEEDSVWLRETMKNKYEIKSIILGPEDHHAQEVKVLGRSLRWTDAGIEYEADGRHQAVVIEELQLDNCRPISTPFGPEEHGCLLGEGKLLEAGGATRYRALVARLNYLAMDRADIQYAVKGSQENVGAA